MRVRAIFEVIHEDSQNRLVNKRFETHESIPVGINKLKFTDKLSLYDLEKNTNLNFIILDIPDDTFAIMQMASDRNTGLYNGDRSTYDMVVPYIEKEWIIKKFSPNETLMDLIVSSSVNDNPILKQNNLLKSITRYINKHYIDKYNATESIVYDYLDYVCMLNAISSIDKKMQDIVRRNISKLIIYIEDNEDTGLDYNILEDLVDKCATADGVASTLRDVAIDIELNKITF